MDAQQWQADQFEETRPHLRAVAYRMLGSTAEAEDAVQEAWLRLNRSDTDLVENLRGWLTTVVSRICLDMLRARQARREELVDGWLAEPIVTIENGSDPEHEALIADSVGLALLVVLERLSPAERLAFVLHDMFGVPFEEIAPVLERNVAATRQLASRARRRVRGADEPSPGSVTQQRRIVEAFLAASRSGDFEALVALLDPEVVFHADRGALGRLAPVETHGREQVAAGILERGRRFAPAGRPAMVNGRPGAVVVIGGRLFAVVTFAIADDLITNIEVVADPKKLSGVRV